MSNINDYINSCAGQPPMSGSSYNDMDALVFANLAYTKFDEVTDPKLRSQLVGAAGPDGISLKDYADIMLASGVEKDANKIELLKAISSSDRYANCKIANCMSTEQSSGTQWAGITIKVDDSTSVVAFRGTDATTEGWAEDFELGYSSGTGAQQESLEYLKRCSADDIRLTGHSKGGNDAISAYMMADESVRSKVQTINNFDGPGVNEEFAQQYKDGYSELDDKLITVRPEDSVIGTLLKDHPGKEIYVKAEADNIFYEHDSYNWQMKDQDGSLTFDETQQSEISKYINNVLDDTLSNLSPEDRAKVLQTLIAIGIPEIIANLDNEDAPPIDYNKLIHQLVGLDPLTKAAIIKLISALLIQASLNGLGYDANLLSNDILDQVVQSLIDKIAIEFGIWLNINQANIVLVTEVINIIDKIIDSIQTIAEGLKTFLNNAWERVKGQFDGTFTDTYIEITPAALIEAADVLDPVSERLEGYREEIIQIRRRMGAWAGVYMVQLMAQEGAISRLGNSCDKTVNALNDIAEIYSSTEDAIKGYL